MSVPRQPLTCGTIYTDDDGKPISVEPCPNDYDNPIDYMHALHAHRDAIASAASAAFDDAFRKAVRR